ncbi:endoribonuclease ZC3H12A-like isoform X2 [Cololabis saira]|nr:endoribonuclease ZC3H12A-like isoform X2 [Cololabis saira]XP_061597996.1 endoribonuclease ZC3H12A-like isoform X2 [Cololabis saira]
MHASKADPSADPGLSETQLDFYHKLGYSTAQVQSIQQKFGPGTDKDKVLGELVRNGASREPQPWPVTTLSALVPRGDSPGDGAALLSITDFPGLGSEGGDALRAVVIDGSNVAMSHGNKEVFSCLGIQLAVDFFLNRGHTDVTVFVPSWRKEQPRPDVPITDQHILRDLEKKKILVFTPSRRVAGKRVVCNDDCFIVKHAFESDGIMVSNDMYRDLQGEKPKWKRFIEERLLMYSFVNNKFMPPDDPLGRNGPTLENFLRKYPKTRKKQPCPYGKKCTYGNKCKFHHPERAKQSNPAVTMELRESVKHPPGSQKPASSRSSPGPGPGLSLEDMAKKLALGDQMDSLQRNEPVSQGKASHRSSKKASLKKEKASQHSGRTWMQHGGSQEQLDSGIGSSLGDGAWSLQDQQYGASYCHQQQNRPPGNVPCSCCSYGPPFWGAMPPYQPHSSSPLSSYSTDISPYGPPRYPGCCSYPGYGQSPDLKHSRTHPRHQRPFWSDPCAAQPPGPRSLQDEPPPGRSPGRPERDVVRKKLLAIFSAQLVDTAMEMFPQLLDPQKLVAEILMLQSQNQSLR